MKKIPLYLDLYQDIKEKIINGAYPKDYKLPSIRAMKKQLNLSKNTISSAYLQLEVEGYVRSVEKVGFFVEELDPVMKLEEKKDKEKQEFESKEKSSYKYDFSFSGVDASLFPFSIWKKMFKKSLEMGSDYINQSDFMGFSPLREAIVSYLSSSRGIKTDPDKIIISGGTEHLFNIVKRLLDKDTLFAFEDPGYAFGANFFTYDLKNPIALSLDKEGVSIESIKNLSSLALLVTPAHQFPTGTVMSIARRIELLNWASQGEERYIIEDDYDGEFKFKERPTPAIKSIDANDDVIYIGSFSKLIAPSLRLSYMILPDKLMEKYKKDFKGFSCPVSLFVQMALANFMDQGYFEKHLNRMRKLYSDKYQIMKLAIEKSENIKNGNNNTGMTFYASFDVKDKESFLKRLKDEAINLSPASNFSQNSKPVNNYLLGFSKIPKDKIEEGIHALDSIISLYK